MTIDSAGNLGLGVTPSAWGSTFKAFDISGGSFSSNGTNINVSANAYRGASAWTYATAAAAGLYQIGTNSHYWYIAPSGSVGSAISWTPAMTLDASGRLGIGTSSPSSLLHVSGSAANIYLASTDTNDATLRYLVNGSEKATQRANNAGALLWETAGSLAMKLDASGNLGINNTSPGSYGRFVVKTATDRNCVISTNGVGNLNDASTAWTQTKYNGNPLIFGCGTYATEGMRIDANGFVGIGTESPSSYGRLAVLNAAGDTSDLLYLLRSGTGTFRVKSPSAGLISIGSPFGDNFAFEVGGTERARIDTSGNLLVGTTSSSSRFAAYSGDNAVAGRIYSTLSSGYSSETFQVIAGQSSGTGFKVAAFYINNAAAYASYIRGDGTIFAVSTTIQAVSDARLKENVKDATDGLDTILALKPRRFDWKSGEGNGKKNQIGFIAQEVEAVFPDAVDIWEKPDDATEYKSVGSTMLVPVLVKAIQELAAKVYALEAKQ
jgi:hypothetical protein